MYSKLIPSNSVKFQIHGSPYAWQNVYRKNQKHNLYSHKNIRCTYYETACYTCPTMAVCLLLQFNTIIHDIVTVVMIPILHFRLFKMELTQRLLNAYSNRRSVPSFFRNLGDVKGLFTQMPLLFALEL